MDYRTVGRKLLLSGTLAALTCSASLAQGWWNPDYTKRVPLTIENPSGGTQPTSNISAEVTVGIPTEARLDARDIRVAYWSGSTWTELDRQIISEAPRFAISENTNAGKTDYSTLPVGTKLTLSGLDDGQAEVIMPFNFTYAGVTSNKLLVASDGFVVPGGDVNAAYFRPDSVAAAAGARLVGPYISDFDTAPGGVWVDMQPTQVTVRWEMAASGGAAIVAKVAMVLYPDNSVRFIYGDTVLQDTGIVTWSTVEYGVGLSAAGSSKITEVTNVDFANHPDITYSGMTSSAPGARIVFRLAAPLADGATSTNQYFLYYANPSPTEPPTNIKNVYDHIVDASAGTVGQLAADWESQEGGAATIAMNGADKVIRLTGFAGISHPRWVIAKGKMPNFLNAESLTQFIPLGGENEVAPMLRAVNDPANGYSDPDRAYSGGYGYVSDGFGSSQGVVSYIKPELNRGPAIVGGVTGTNGVNPSNVLQNTLFRADGSMLSGKKWSPDQAEPAGFVVIVDRATAGGVNHDGVDDPIYDLPGATGFGSYSTSGIDAKIIALRELLTGTTPGTASTNVPTGPFIQGTVTSSAGALNPLTIAKVRITGPGGYDQTFYVGSAGEYKVSLPSGTGPYAVTATAVYHTTVIKNVNPSASDKTDIILPYVGARITGKFKEALTRVPQANAKIVLLDADGYNVAQTTTDASGNYSLLAPTGGSYQIGGISLTGIGDRQPAAVASGGAITVNLNGGIPANGDCEIPNAGNNYPLDWTNGFTAPVAYLYVRNGEAGAPVSRKVGDRWCIGIDQGGDPSAWNPPPAAFYDLPIQANAFNVDVVVWVYFTQVGQEVRLRLRNNWPGTFVQIVAGSAPPANQVSTANPPGNVPVGQWYEIRARHLVTDGELLNNAIQINLYQYGRLGKVYFDDLKVEQTAIAAVIGKLIDEAGQPVVGGYAGVLGNTSDYTLVGPVARTDENGEFVMYSPVTGSLKIGGWKPALPAANGAMPAYDYVMAVATANAQPTPGAPVVMQVSRAGNVAKGTTATCKTLAGADANADQWPRITDDNYSTRNDSGGGNGIDIVYTVDLGSNKSIDQVQLFWELARPATYAVSVGTDINSLDTVFDTTTGSNIGINGLDITPFAEGPMVIHRFPTAMNVRYIVINCAGFTSGLGNYSMIEIRALSKAVLPPLDKTDVAKALAIAGGLVQATSADVARLDKNADGKVTLEDADRIARTLAGL